MDSAVRTGPRAAGPVAALAGIVALDLLRTGRDWPIPVLGLLDEPAHLLTAWLAVAAWSSRTVRVRLLPWVLLGAVAIDVDHIPLYLGADGITADGDGRPVTHSLLTVAVLLAAALVAGHPLLGLAAGVGLHLVRDLATGPGLPLLWPVADADVRVPYLPYLVLLVVLTLIATGRRISAPATGAAGAG